MWFYSCLHMCMCMYSDVYECMFMCVHICMLVYKHVSPRGQHQVVCFTLGIIFQGTQSSLICLAHWLANCRDPPVCSFNVRITDAYTQVFKIILTYSWEFYTCTAVVKFTLHSLPSNSYYNIPAVSSAQLCLPVSISAESISTASVCMGRCSTIH